MKKLFIGLICAQFLLSCEQISKSIDDTFKPGDTLVNRENKNPSKTIQTSTHTVTSTHSTTHTQEHVDGKRIHFLLNTGALQKAEEELRKLPKYEGKEIFVYSTVYFYDDGLINVMLQHPENPKYVDAYEYRDHKWSGPTPIQLSVRDDIHGRLVSLNTINFESAAKVTDIYNTKAKEIEGAKTATSVYLSIWNNQIRWFPTMIDGSRERYSIQFNEDGTLKSFKQD